MSLREPSADGQPCVTFTSVDLGGRQAAKYHVAGLPVVEATVESALRGIWSDVADSRPRVYALLNAYSSVLRRSDPGYASAIEDELVVPLPDGYAVTLGARLLGLGEIGRCPGPDLFTEASRRAALDGVSFYLLGGGPGIALSLKSALERRFPGINIVGIHTPPFGEWGEAISMEMCESITRSNADVVWLGVSAPKQEVWARHYLSSIDRPVVCVGAAYDFLSGAKTRAPKWMRYMGMEWLFRLLSEPKRLWRRYLVGNLVFLGDLLRLGVRPR